MKNQMLFKSLDQEKILNNIINIITIFTLIVLFLVGVKSLGSSFKMLGGGFVEGLLNTTSNPILALFAGMLATVLVQSSSVTTSIIVGMVASGSLPMSGAIPMIMGANLGTSVTNSIVSLGHIQNKEHFRNAFAAATVHDFFNILTVIVLLPLEILFGFLEKAATNLASVLYGTASSFKFSSPIKALIAPFVKYLKMLITSTLGITGHNGGLVMMILSGVIIIFALSLIVKTMKKLMENNKLELIEKLLSQSGYASILYGAILTFAVQSSSITTSLLVPMAGSGLITLNTILPITIGANIGTTTTAILASLTGNVAGLAIALVHFLFNLSGMVIWYIHPSLRNVPINMSSFLSQVTLKNRIVGISYITGVFFILPFLLTFFL